MTHYKNNNTLTFMLDGIINHPTLAISLFGAALGLTLNGLYGAVSGFVFTAFVCVFLLGLRPRPLAYGPHH